MDQWDRVERAAQGKRHAERLAAAGLTARMAFEVEWVFDAGSGDEVVPAMGGSADGMTRLIERSDYAAELLGALAAQGVGVAQFHPEYAAGQLEISVAAESPVAAADTTVLVRTTIRAVADTVVAPRRAEIERFAAAKPEEIVAASWWLP